MSSIPPIASASNLKLTSSTADKQSEIRQEIQKVLNDIKTNTNVYGEYQIHDLVNVMYLMNQYYAVTIQGVTSTMRHLSDLTQGISQIQSIFNKATNLSEDDAKNFITELSARADLIRSLHLDGTIDKDTYERLIGGIKDVCSKFDPAVVLSNGSLDFTKSASALEVQASVVAFWEAQKAQGTTAPSNQAVSDMQDITNDFTSMQQQVSTASTDQKSLFTFYEQMDSQTQSLMYNTASFINNWLTSVNNSIKNTN
ncbi:MAG: hypothetical protein ACOVOR_01955 [Rhabdochlamydiaceae bacterium]